MAISYDQRKKSYEWMDDTQKQQYNDALKNKWDDYIGNQYMKQYQQANTPQSDDNSSNFNNQNGVNWQNSTNNQTPTITKTENQNNFDSSETLDTNKFWATNWKVVVKEWTAAQTGMPDYQNSTDARMQEITNNLNAYRQNNPEYFKDRQTFNTMFHYNDRDESQKALLDTYWKKKQDIDKANLFTTWDSIANWMKDADITPDQLNYIKEYNNEAYREWQQKQLDDINLRIANLATPADPTDNAELFNTLLEKLNLEPWDPYQIYDNWYSMCERLGVFTDSEKLKSYQNQLDANHSKMESIMNRYANSTWWTVSDALAAARMQKALAPYQQMEVDLQNSYTTLLNGRNSNLAVANQSAQVLAMQAQEDQRVWNQRLQGLGFAMSTAQYRSPEQQAQLQLQTQQIQNDMSLLQQSRQNDLSLYNTYATTKLQNQLQAELTDLSVEDEAQLKANLNNVLSDYYKNYWDIIKRSQAEVVDDVIAYAKKNWISVAQALRENFIEPLQSKAEYKQKIATDYGMLSKQTVTTINWKSVIMTTNPNWSISYRYIDDIDNQWKKWAAKAYNQVDSRAFTADPISTGYEWKTLYDFISDPKNKEWNTWGQCWKFVNDYLQSIWVTDANNRYYDNELSTKLNSVNTDIPTVWSIAVFDYNHKSSDWINHGHVGIVVEVDKDWKGFRVLDSNWDLDKPETIEKRHILYWSPSCKGFFDPSKPASATTNGESEWYVSWRIWLYDKYINQWTKPTDAMLKSWGDGDISKWLDKFEAEVEAYKQAQWYTDTYSPEAVSEITSLRKEFNNLDTVETYRSMQDYYDKLLKANNWTAAWDMAMVFNFMKMLDPNSVVREWEYASAAATRWLGSTLIQYFKKVDSWEILTKSQREDFINIAKEYLQWAADRYNRDLKQYRTYITKWWNPDWIWLYAELDTTTWPTTDKEKYFDWLYPTTTYSWAWAVVNTDINFILNG